MEKYEWGGGCNGDKSKPHCPENLTQTLINARKMWQAVARALKTTDEAAPRFVPRDWNSVGKKSPLTSTLGCRLSVPQLVPPNRDTFRRPHWPYEDQVRVSVVCVACAACYVLCGVRCACATTVPRRADILRVQSSDEFVLNDANGLLTGTVAIGAAAVESWVPVHAAIADHCERLEIEQARRSLIDVALFASVVEEAIVILNFVIAS